MVTVFNKIAPMPGRLMSYQVFFIWQPDKKSQLYFKRLFSVVLTKVMHIQSIIHEESTFIY